MKNLIAFFMQKIKKDNMGAYSAQASMFLVMSLIPFLLILLSLLQYTPVQQTDILTILDLFIPDNVMPFFSSVIADAYSNSRSLLVVSIIFAVYSAAKTIHSLRYGLNIVYDIEETRNWFMLRLRAMLDTFLLIIAVVLLLLLIVFGKNIQEVIVANAPYVAVITAWILKLRFLISFFVLIVVFAGIYKVLPNRKATFRSQLVGAVGCAAAWYVFTGFVALYVKVFHGFSFYGSLTTLVLIMFWLYFAFYIFFVCGAVNSSLELIFEALKIQNKTRRDERKEHRDEVREERKEHRDEMREERKEQREEKKKQSSWRF